MRAAASAGRQADLSEPHGGLSGSDMRALMYRSSRRGAVKNAELYFARVEWTRRGAMRLWEGHGTPDRWDPRVV